MNTAGTDRPCGLVPGPQAANRPLLDRPAPPLEVKLVLHDITAQPVANVAHVFFERVEHGGTATLLQCGPSLLWNALTTLRSSSHGAATSASAARAVLVLAFVSALCQTHGTEFLCLGHEDWLAFLNTVDEAAYRELRSWAREELRGLGAPEHVAATVLEHAHEDREDLEAALESQIQSALDWAQRFFAVRDLSLNAPGSRRGRRLTAAHPDRSRGRCVSRLPLPSCSRFQPDQTRSPLAPSVQGQFQPPPAAQFASLGHHAPSRFFPQDRRLVSSSSSRF